MARPREPINLVEAKGRKHLTKAEIDARQRSEVAPIPDGIAPPKFLTKKQKDRFNLISEQLKKLKIIGETDVDALSRYVVAEELYEQAVKDLRSIHSAKPKKMQPKELSEWVELLDVLDKRQDRYFKQATAAARDLGLTISSRCKLVMPVVDEPQPVNKFAKFAKEAKSG